METVILKTFDNYFSASIILTRLKDAGIQCFLADEYTSTIYPIFNNNASGGIKLAVDKIDEEEAIQMLAAFDAEYLSAAICPVCNRNEFELINKPMPANFLQKILSKFFKKLPVDTEQIYRCGHCNYETPSLPLNTVEHN